MLKNMIQIIIKEEKHETIKASEKNLLKLDEAIKMVLKENILIDKFVKEIHLR